MHQLGLIGFPIKHSLSPWIHEQFLDKAGLDGSYSLIEIHPDQNFAEEMSKLRKQGINGFNVTVPYKQTIIPFLDEIDIEAEKMGAVNTVVNDGGKWIGYNTDGKGYLRSLESKFPGFLQDQTKKILILGAGGAARGIYYALVNAGFKQIDIANRTAASATEIAELKNDSINTNVLSLEQAEKSISEYDIFIQTTSVGMNPVSDATIVSLNGLKESAIVSDIVYQPIETAFLKKARSLGGSVHFGHTMLLYQAQYAFEIWTNQQIPIDHMDDELQLILKGR